MEQLSGADCSVRRTTGRPGKFIVLQDNHKDTRYAHFFFCRLYESTVKTQKSDRIMFSYGDVKVTLLTLEMT